MGVGLGVELAVAVAVAVGVEVGEGVGVGVAGQVRSRTDTLFEPELAAARSCTPSPLKSPTATDTGRVPTVKFDAAAKVMPAHAGGVVTVSIKVRVVEPPGPNAQTVTVYAPGGSLAG